MSNVMSQNSLRKFVIGKNMLFVIKANRIVFHLGLGEAKQLIESINNKMVIPISEWEVPEGHFNWLYSLEKDMIKSQNYSKFYLCLVAGMGDTKLVLPDVTLHEYKL